MVPKARNEGANRDGKASDGHPLVKAFICQKAKTQSGQVGDNQRHCSTVDRTADRSENTQPVTPAAQSGFFR